MFVLYVGVAWIPQEKSGEVSTTVSGKSVWKAAATVNPGLVANIDEEKDWRHKYVNHVVALAELGVASNENGLKIAENGLHEMYKQFDYVQPGTGDRLSLEDALKRPAFTFETVEARGAKVALPPRIVKHSEALVGEKAGELVQKWANYGSCEPDVASSVKAMLALPREELAAILEKHVFVLLGATSAMGPVEILLDLGATVIGVCRNG
jgi:hypothetical protein